MDGNTVIVMALLGLCILPSCSAQFYHIVTAAMTWTDAQSYCREKYTDLVTINSMEDMVRLRDQLGGKDDDQFWIGLYGDLDNWKWSLEKEGNEEGQAEYSVWYPGQPNMYSGVLACGNIDTEGTWSDYSCNAGLPFICYNEFSETKYIYVSTPMNWINAQRYCRERYTDLASMRNEPERNEMKMLVKKSAWIGLYRVAWKWSDGQIMDVTSFQKWSTGQPKKIKHYCVTTTHGGWNARPCSDKYAFVCRVRKQVRVKVMLKTSDSSVDLEDMQDAILQQPETEGPWQE
ncbi:lymphocyte antigen 75-like isoform X2 [Amphiprion ocellaris]|uniref:lymphocyte antigen 75-like isoform X2 n=1 Tax=Amphiprion ocellaris TaxID=80972 RepID=UPI002410D8FB|nr:lymphocyte antigen 75-like isoform X2 [Amphiprion ocellaris]